jgi:hypothetical protein
MTTLGLQDAAKFVRLHPETLAARARAGKIPGAAKPGKEWVFLEEGLRAYLLSLSPCHSLDAETGGGSTSPRTRAELESLLGLPTRKKRRNTTQSASRRYGVETS